MANSKRIHTVTIQQTRLGVGSFARINLKAIAEVSLTPGCCNQTIESRCEYGIYPENETNLPAFEQERLAELREQLHAIGFSKRAISAAFKNIQHQS